MTDAQFAAYAAVSSDDYARASPNYRDWELADAIADARKSFDRRLHAGPRTPGAYLLAILLTEGGVERQIGYFDIGETPLGSKNVYIWNVALDESVRGRGYGKAAMTLALEYLRGCGYAKVGLNVFAENAVARKIYADAGFVVTQLNMEKKL
jgi:ribosomal protein S18 acetylase RimI-like enzyme